MLQLQRQNEKNTQNLMNTQINSINISYSINARMSSMNIHDVYNFSSINHNEILQKKSFFALKQTLRMQRENVIIKNYKLHHSVWEKLLYSRQYLLLNDLLITMRIVNVTLLLFQNIMIKNYQNSKIIINLSFAIIEIVDKLIFCNVIYEIKNSFDHLFIDTILDLKA